MEQAGIIVLACALAFVINLVPAFMPATWMLLAVFYVRFDLPLLPLTICGALASGLGRLVLAKGSGEFKRRFVHRKGSDIEVLGRVLRRHRNYLVGVVFFYALLLPLPTSTLFIAAGTAGLPLQWVVLSFWVARIIADAFWVWTASTAINNFGDLFAGTVSGWQAVTLQVAGIALIVVFFRLPWAKCLSRFAEDPEDTPGGGFG